MTQPEHTPRPAAPWPRRLRTALKRTSAPLRGWWPRFSDAVIGMFALAVVAFALLTYSTSISRYTSHFLSDNKYTALVNGLLNPFRTRHMLLESGLPVYDIRIKKQQYARIQAAVEQAREQGYMDESLKVWADAKFIHDGQSYNAKIRVRGDLPPHWEGAKKSWRIKFGKQRIEEDGEARREPIYFQGKRQINLIIPRDRDYILAFFINSLLRDAGLVVPRDRFAVLRINGTLQGLYYEVEHFDKPLLAAHRRPETPVFAQNDRAMHFDKYGRYGTPGVKDARFDTGALRQLVNREEDLGVRAMRVLQEHARNPTEENFTRARSVLDWERYLRFRVLTTLCNTNHVRFGSDNLRLYYDSSRGLLEPIPWDVHVTRMPGEPGTIDFWNSHGPDEIQRATLEDPLLRLERNRVLWELVGDADALLQRYDTIHHEIRPLAWADVLTTPVQAHKMDERRKALRYNVRRIHKVLSHSSANLTFLRETPARAALELAVTNFSGLRVKGLRLSDPKLFQGTYRLYEDANDDGLLDAADPLLAEVESRGGRIELPLDRLLLPGVEYGGDFIGDLWWEYHVPVAGRLRLFLTGRIAPQDSDPLEWAPPRIRVTAENAVTHEAVESRALDHQGSLPTDTIAVTALDASDPYDLDAIDRSRDAFLSGHPEFRKSDARPGAVALRGRVSLERTAIVPRSVPLIVEAGAELTLGPQISLITYGGLELLGTGKAPVRIRSLDPERPWGVVAAVRPPRTVVGRHLHVTGGGQAQVNGILFTGGFAVHEGDLELEHCSFVAMHSEDGVNLKNGRVHIEHCLFANGASDGIDLDFVTGEVRSSAFVNNAGDGLDLSGSRVLIAGNRFERMGDKGISVGEDSHPLIVNNLIRGNPIGLSTKDLSFARVAYTTFVDNRLAIEAKRKKPFFGGGGGEFTHDVFASNAELVSEDYFSRGRVQMTASQLDALGTECAGCWIGPAEFRAPEIGDYRLASERVWAAAQPVTWIEEWADGRTPAVPGIYTDLGRDTGANGESTPNAHSNEEGQS